MGAKKSVSVCVTCRTTITATVLRAALLRGFSLSACSTEETPCWMLAHSAFCFWSTKCTVWCLLKRVAPRTVLLLRYQLRALSKLYRSVQTVQCPNPRHPHAPIASPAYIAPGRARSGERWVQMPILSGLHALEKSAGIPSGASSASISAISRFDSAQPKAAARSSRPSAQAPPSSPHALTPRLKSEVGRTLMATPLWSAHRSATSAADRPCAAPILPSTGLSMIRGDGPGSPNAPYPNVRTPAFSP
eukprot:scaffold27882_cov122-Isochrysis_galbana.AAC.4